MNKCPECKTELSLLGMMYKGLNQYLCTVCNEVYLETKVGLVSKAVTESMEQLMGDEKFMNLLKRLGEFNETNR